MRQSALLDFGGALGRGQQPAHAAPRRIRQGGEDGVTAPQKIIGVRLAAIGRTRGSARIISAGKAFCDRLLAPFPRAGRWVCWDWLFTASTVVAF
jgi:hypothetical protein